VIKHDDLIGLNWGSQVFSHIGSPFFLLQPSLPDLLKNTPRATQICTQKILPISYWLWNWSGISGDRSRTGSGALTTALAHAVGEPEKCSVTNIVKSINLKPKRTWKDWLIKNVGFKLKDIREGFDEIEVMLYSSMWLTRTIISNSRAALKPGGYFAVSCLQQIRWSVCSILKAIWIAFIDVCEISLRYYKPEPSALDLPIAWLLIPAFWYSPARNDRSWTCKQETS